MLTDCQPTSLRTWLFRKDKHLGIAVHQCGNSVLGFDEDGKRKIKIGNPLGTEFNPIDPSLSKYLKIRAVKNKQRGL